jgi:hypothetical protein
VRWDASWNRGTHKAQNTRHDIVVMNDICLYVCLKASILGVDCCNTMEGEYTYARHGSKKVGIKRAAAVGCYTVMFGTNLA